MSITPETSFEFRRYYSPSSFTNTNYVYGTDSAMACNAVFTSGLGDGKSGVEDGATYRITYKFERQTSSAYETQGLVWRITRSGSQLSIYSKLLSQGDESFVLWGTQADGPVPILSGVGLTHMLAYPETEVAGTFQVLEQYYKEGTTPPAFTAAISYDVRFLVVDNLQASRPVFNPQSDENTTTITGDFVALPLSTSLYPSGWKPSGNIDWTVDLVLPGETTPLRTSFSGSVAVNTTVVNGVVASFGSDTVSKWDGLDSSNAVVQSLVNVLAAGVASSVPSVGGTSTRLGWTQVLSTRCGCKCVGVSGLQTFSTALDFGGLAVPPRYCATEAARSPQSMGYGWAMVGRCRVIEQTINGVDHLIYRDESGGYLRWKKVSGAYVAWHPDNYVEATKVTGNPNYTYQLVFQDQSRREFDPTGLLLRDVDRNGNTLTYTYSSDRLNQLTDDFGRTLFFNYGGRTDGQPVSIRINHSTAGRLIELDYDTSGRLIEIKNSAGETQTFSYSSTSGVLEAIYDARGNEVRFYVHDELGRVIQEYISFDQALKLYEYAPDLPRVRTIELDLTETSPLRLVDTYYDRHSNVVAVDEWVSFETEPVVNYGTGQITLVFGDEDIVNSTVMLYEDSNNPHLLTMQIAPNLTTTEYEYNGQGNLRFITDSAGNVTEYQYADDIDSPLNPMHRNLLRKVYRSPVTVPGNSTPVQYDPTELIYDTNGNLVEVVDSRGHSTLFTVRTDGLISDITDRRGYVTSFLYNDDMMPSEPDRKLLRQIITPGDGTDNPSRTTTLHYDALYDNVIEIEDSMGNSWTTAYDALDRITQSTDARGKSTSWEYGAPTDPLAGLLEMVTLPANAGSGASTRKTNFSYDSSGRLTQVDSDISSTTQEMRVKFEFDGLSQIRKLIRKLDTVDKFTAYDYDRLGRATSVKDPLDEETVIAHAPYCNETMVTTPRGVTRRTRYDSLCRMHEARSASSDKLKSDLQRFEYDELHRLVQEIQLEQRYGTARYHQKPYGSSRKYKYDELDRLTEVTFEDQTTMLYEYDNESNLTKWTDTESNVTEYAYYKDNRLKEVRIKRTGESDRVFTYRYDEAGRLKTITYPTSTGIVANFGYDNSGTWVHGWNENGQLTYLDYRKSGASLRKLEYTYDDTGNRTSLTDTPAGVAADRIVWDYNYDWLNRLSAVERSMPGASPAVDTIFTTYLYDESDNRKEFTYKVGTGSTVVTTYTRNTADQVTERKVGGVTQETFAYDADGNMTSRVLNPGGSQVTTTYTWDDYDRLVRFQKSSPSTDQSQRYDSGNIRKTKTATDGTTFTYRYNGLAVGNETKTPPSSSPIKTALIMGHQLLGFDQAGTFYYFITDGLSSVRLVVDEDGDVVASYDADEFGNSILVDENGASTDQRWVGGLGYKDETAATGLYYLRQRYYDPSLGRFLRRDPVGIRGGLNPYSYVLNSPVNIVDPMGLGPIRIFIEVSVGVYKAFKGGEKSAVKRIRRSGTNFLLEGGACGARETKAVRMGESAWGKGNVEVHYKGDHPPGVNARDQSHVQPRNRNATPMSGRGHIYFSIPLATFGGDYLGGPGEFFDNFLNPFNDVQFGVELLGEPAADLGSYLGDAYAKVVEGCPDWPGQEQFSSQPYFYPDLPPGEKPRQWPPKGYFDFGEEGRYP